MESTANRSTSRLSHGYFECLDCSHRLWSETRVHDCPDCGHPTVNIGVARE